MRFVSLLADNPNHASLKVYLSAVRSLHIDHGLPVPLVNCRWFAASAKEH